MIKLSQEQVKELEAYIQEMPVKYGLPLLNFFQKLNAEQNPEPKQETPILEEK